MHQAEGIDQQMPFAAFDQLAAIKAPLVTTPLDGLDRLTVEDASRGLRVPPSSTTDLCAQAVVQALPGGNSGSRIAHSVSSRSVG